MNMNRRKIKNYFPNPYEKQKQFHNDERKYRWFCGGVGSGKTLSGVRESFYLSWMKFPGKRGIVCAPSFPLLRQGFLEKFVQLVPSNLYILNQQKWEIKFKNGSKIYLRSTSNPESMRGIDAAWIGFDEPGSEPNGEIFNEFKARLREDPNAVFWMTGTPCGKYHWTAKVFGTGPETFVSNEQTVTMKGTNDYWYNDKFAVIRANTWDNPKFPKDCEYVQDLLNNPESTPEFISQQVLAEFTSYEGIIFPQFVNNNLITELSENDFTELFIGFDFGYTDYGALLLMGYNSNTGKYGCIKEIYHKSMMVDESGWIGEIKKVKLQYGSKLKWLVADEANPERIAAIRKAIPNLPVYKTSKATNGVIGSIRKVQKLFGEGNLLVNSSCKHLISELNQYQWDSNKEKDKVKSGTPDHLVDCLRYGIEKHVGSKDSGWSLTNQGSGISNPLTKKINGGLGSGY